MNSIMAIGAHCDDIEFTVAGTLLKYHRTKGYSIVYVEATNNMSGLWKQATCGEYAASAPVPPEGSYAKQEKILPDRIVYNVPWFIEQPQRKKEADEAARRFFDTEAIHLDYPQRGYLDEALNSVSLSFDSPRPSCVQPGEPTIVTACDSELEVNRVRDLILDRNPEVIFTHNVQDNNPEHFGTAALVKRAFSAARKEGYDGSLLLWNGIYSFMFGYLYDVWDAYIDTTGYYEDKLRALITHSCQVPYPPKVTDMADTMYGEIMGVETAETFHTAYLSSTRAGELSDELRSSHAYCRENFQKLFFSPEKEQRIRGFFEEAFQYNRML